MNIVLIQSNPLVGDIKGNTKKVIDAIKQQTHASCLVFPELMLTGYPPDDLLLESTLPQMIKDALNLIQSHCPNHMTLLVGTPHYSDSNCFNSCAIISGQQHIRYVDKHHLPSYGVFNEPRHFTPGSPPTITTINQQRCLILICEDMWHSPPDHESVDCIISLNASPFTRTKFDQRLAIAKQYSDHYQAPVFYCNCVGGQDELVFDGQSFIYHRELKALGAHCEEDQIYADSKDSIAKRQTPSTLALYQAIKLSLYDYCQKNRIQQTVIGLSGGIDSALCLALLADLFPVESIHAFYLPSPFNSTLSTSLAHEQCNALGITLKTIDIRSLLSSYETTLQDQLDFHHPDVHQNIQARIRGDILMAHANAKQALLITTSNKSEAAMGYCTLYGDMAGGFAPLKDLFKTEVIELAQHCHTTQKSIPMAVISRPPSAELAPNQLDSDSLPDYQILDRVLKTLLQHENPQPLATALPIDNTTLSEIISRLYRNEHKRFQMPPGPVISDCALSRDRQWPITLAYNYQL